MRSRTGFHGIYPMLYAFFGADGRLDGDAMRRQVEGCIAAGVHGLAILGIASEMNKLSSMERRRFLDISAEAVDGRVPLAVTVPEANIEDQVEFARAAEAAGAAWLILQPPPVKGVPEIELLRFFGAVADRCALPVAVQNNPVNMDVFVSNAGLASLARQHGNIVLLKGEGPALATLAMIEATQGLMDVFGGLAGKEITSILRAGCVGCIPAPDCVDVHVTIYEAMQQGDEALAEQLYRDILPLITFVNSSVEGYLCYGKRLVAERLGLCMVHPRAPAIAPHPFGRAIVERHARALGPFGNAAG